MKYSGVTKQLPGNQRRLQQVAALNQEFSILYNLSESANWWFYTLVFCANSKIISMLQSQAAAGVLLLVFLAKLRNLRVDTIITSNSSWESEK